MMSDFTAIYLGVIAGIAWTSRLAVANLSAAAALLATVGADVVARPSDPVALRARHGTRIASTSAADSCVQR
jgi:hypothetical protein